METNLMEEHKFSIFPVKNKKPLVDWKIYSQRFPNEEEIHNWDSTFNYPDYGIPTGKLNGILVLDIDSESAFDDIDKLGGVNSIPLNTWRSKSPKGWHFYFKWNNKLDSFSTTKVGILNHVDVRGEGGYVVRYPWIARCSPDDVELAEIPEWLMTLLTKKEDALIEINRPGWMREVLNTLKDGNRHQSFARLIGWFNRNGASKEDTYTLLSHFAKESNFEAAELWKEIDRMFTLYQGQSKVKTFTSISANKLIKESDPKIKWLIDSIMPSEGIGIIAGSPGYGKSWMLLDLAVDVASCRNWLNKFPVLGGRVMYIDEESTKGLIRYRLNKLLNFKELKSDNLLIEFFIGEGLSFTNEESLNKFREKIDLYQPNLIIIDSLIRVHGAEENNATLMAQMFSKVKQIVKDFQCAVIFADHTRKTVGFESSSDQQLRGSSEKMAAIDTCLAISRLSNNLLIDHTKSRYAEPVKPFEISIVDRGDNKTEVKYIG